MQGEIFVENSVALKSITENSSVLTNVCLAVTGSANKHGFNYPCDAMSGICYIFPCKRQLFVSCKIFNCRNCVASHAISRQTYEPCMSAHTDFRKAFQLSCSTPRAEFSQHYKRRASAFYICQTKLELLCR